MKHCVVAVLLLVKALLAGVTAFIHTSSSSSGTGCSGDNWRRCSEVCDNGHCTCVDRSNTGVPAIVCLSSEYNVCSVRGDPTIYTFSNETFEYRIPCQYTLTGGLNSFNSTEYDFQVFAYNRRRRGKFFPAGFRVDITRRFGMTNNYLGFRVDGRADFGQYTYITTASIDGGTSWFDFVSKSANPILDVDTYSLTYDNVYNRFYFEYPEIGLIIVFRASDDGYRWYNQNYLSGIVVGLKPSDDLVFSDYGLCFSPSSPSDNVVDPALDPEASLLMLSSSNDLLPQSFLGAAGECFDLYDPITTCENPGEVTNSINTCIEVFQEEEFVNCTASFDDSDDSSSVLALFQNCILTYCQFDDTGCSAMTQVTNTDCPEYTPAGISGLDCNDLP